MAVFEADGTRARAKSKLNFVPKSIVLREGRWKTQRERRKKAVQISSLLSPRKKESSWTSQHIFLLSF